MAEEKTQYNQPMGIQQPAPMMQQQPAPMMQQQPAPMAVPPGGQAVAVTPGVVSFLSQLSQIRIQQLIEIAEVLTGFECSNRYEIVTADTRQLIMFAREDADCCERQCCANLRSFNIMFTDNFEQPIMNLTRDLRCQGCLCCCCLQVMTINIPANNPVAIVKELWTCLTPKYEVTDMSGNLLFYIEGEASWICKPCCNVKFEIFGPDRTNPIGHVIRDFQLKECLGGYSDFDIQFPQNMDVNAKMIVLGAAFLIDYMYFERKQR